MTASRSALMPVARRSFPVTNVETHRPDVIRSLPRRFLRRIIHLGQVPAVGQPVLLILFLGCRHLGYWASTASVGGE